MLRLLVFKQFRMRNRFALLAELLWVCGITHPHPQKREKAGRVWRPALFFFSLKRLARLKLFPAAAAFHGRIAVECLGDLGGHLACR